GNLSADPYESNLAYLESIAFGSAAVLGVGDPLTMVMPGPRVEVSYGGTARQVSVVSDSPTRVSSGAEDVIQYQKLKDYYRSLDDQAAIGVPYSRSTNPYSIVQDYDRLGNEILYRTMSSRDYDNFLITGKVPATGETFMSPLEAYSRGYNGTLVRYAVEPGTADKLLSIGGYGNKGTLQYYPELPHAGSGWTSEMSQIKLEGQDISYINSGNGVVNTGLGRGDALDIFNNNIIKYEVLN
ncbi:hypothetical protein BTA51_28465, partial [Hahella sp. CCB-MM4]|uniref:hypothetical protein n=1 Tax=Hahella sp. (strain CCB-MM4) TaxID=1926491 RepID=UPI000B9AA946